MASGKKWLVYENLNNPTDRIVAAADHVVAGIYVKIAGPFTDKKEADKASQKPRGSR